LGHPIRWDLTASDFHADSLNPPPFGNGGELPPDGPLLGGA
jgi:hypothetical protein